MSHNTEQRYIMVQHPPPVRYTASKSRSQNRPGYSISFRHPLRSDAKNRAGLKVRRGLNTSDPAQADALVAEMNELLSDPSWWNAARRGDAESRFDSIIVEAFYGDIQAGQANSRATRDRLLPLPSRDDGYAHVLFVGTTGAGKTSLLRHLIGSDPNSDRFPSTSTAKTTVSDIEVVPQEGVFRAAVTFSSEFLVQANIEDCVLNAFSAVWEKENDERISERLLNHPDQRFRLTYVLGSWRPGGAKVEDEGDWFFGESDDAELETAATETLTTEEQRRNQAALESYVRRVRSSAQPLKAQILAEFGDLAGLSADDASAAFELFQEEVEETSDFTDLVRDLMADVLERFDYLTEGALHRPRSSSRWPEYWTFETEDRNRFIEHIRWFSSNFAPSFGRLLTPLVDGIRVLGPLYPAYQSTRRKVVLIDGQGLGHTADSSSSISTHITRRFAEVDVILLVDNAEQPIQAAAQAVLRAVASSGHYEKVAIAFTHFDQVKGANLPTVAAKKSHVIGSLDNYLTALRDTLNAPVVSAMARALSRQCFMLGGLDVPSLRLPRGVVLELERLGAFFEKAVEAAELPEARPVYDPSGIAFAVQNATGSFQKPWAARLKLAYISGVKSEHWTRIKALSHRVAGELDVEYDDLRPVADLVARLSEEISKFLDNPHGWTRTPDADEDAQQAISAVRRAVFSALHDLVLRRLVQDYLGDWRVAFARSGRGSAYKRAVDLKGIYECAAPIPGTVNSEPALALLREIRAIVSSAVEESGGELRLEVPQVRNP